MSPVEITKQLSNLHPVLRSFTKRFTSDRDESLDLVQDTVLRALMNKDKFRENTNLKGWLFTIMRNVFINNYRKGQLAKHYRNSVGEVHHLKSHYLHTFNSPASSLEYDDTWKHIDTIRQELLIPFKMHTLGYKYHEIAEDQKIPVGTVKNRIFHARKEIQKKLTDNELAYE